MAVLYPVLVVLMENLHLSFAQHFLHFSMCHQDFPPKHYHLTLRAHYLAVLHQPHF